LLSRRLVLLTLTDFQIISTGDDFGFF